MLCLPFLNTLIFFFYSCEIVVGGDVEAKVASGSNVEFLYSGARNAVPSILYICSAPANIK